MVMTYAPQGLWTPPRAGTLVVAASDATEKSRAQADGVGNGTADEVKINDAIDEVA